MLKVTRVKRLLLVDDDPDFCEILVEALHSHQQSVMIASIADSFDAAQKEILSNNVADFAAIILDLCLPKSDSDATLIRDAGLQLVRLLRSERNFPGPVIVLTNSVSFADGKIALNAGCDAYLCKSRDLQDLIDSILFCVQDKGMVVSPEMRHLFLPEEVSAKEARLLDMLLDGNDWVEIANALGYKNAHGASSTADRVFDKLLTWHDVKAHGHGQTKRQVALQLWRWRHRSHVDHFFTSATANKIEM